MHHKHICDRFEAYKSCKHIWNTVAVKPLLRIDQPYSVLATLRHLLRCNILNICQICVILVSMYLVEYT